MALNDQLHHKFQYNRSQFHVHVHIIENSKLHCSLTHRQALESLNRVKEFKSHFRSALLHPSREGNKVEQSVAVHRDFSRTHPQMTMYQKDQGLRPAGQGSRQASGPQKLTGCGGEAGRPQRGGGCNPQMWHGISIHLHSRPFFQKWAEGVGPINSSSPINLFQSSAHTQKLCPQYHNGIEMLTPIAIPMCQLSDQNLPRIYFNWNMGCDV